MNRPRLYQKRFRKWLESRQNQIVGRSATPDACPLANYLTSMTGEICATTGETWWFKMPSGRTYWSTPKWAMKFVDRVDVGGGGYLVSGAHALDILDG